METTLYIFILGLLTYYFILGLLTYYFFGKKLVAGWVSNKLVKVGFNVNDCYVSGDLSWAICYDVSQKKFALFRIFKSTVDLYHISHIRKCEIEIFEGKSNRTISLPNTLIGALAGGLIGGNRTTRNMLTGAAIGAATSPNLLGAQEMYIKNVFLYLVTSNNAYRINFKPLMRRKTNNNEVSEAIRWNKLINHLP